MHEVEVPQVEYHEYPHRDGLVHEDGCHHHVDRDDVGVEVHEHADG